MLTNEVIKQPWAWSFLLSFNLFSIQPILRKTKETTGNRGVEHTFYHEVVDMFRVGLQEADVKADATIITIKGRRCRGSIAAHMGNDLTNTQVLDFGKIINIWAEKNPLWE